MARPTSGGPPEMERGGPRQATSVTSYTNTLPTTIAEATDGSRQRIAERVARVRRAREYRQQVRAVLERNRAAGKALRHAARLAAQEPVGTLHWTEVQ